MFEAFHRWLDRRLRIDAYVLCGDEVVSTGLPKQRIRLADIRIWQSYYISSGVPSIASSFLMVETRIAVINMSSFSKF
jgi:hypothetical protein